jgi:hypothetical protein
MMSNIKYKLILNNIIKEKNGEIPFIEPQKSWCQHECSTISIVSFLVLHLIVLYYSFLTAHDVNHHLHIPHPGRVQHYRAEALPFVPTEIKT